MLARPIDSCPSVSLESRTTVNVGRYAQTFQPNLSIPAMLVGAIDFYNFISLSVTLTFLGITRSVKAKHADLIFTHTFQLNYI